MNIVKSTQRYEAALGKRITLLPADLEVKHQRMASGAFPFLRATYYRWSELFPELCPSEATAPHVLAVGDLHIENFGSWRDAEGRLIWGCNDFDEAGSLPYSSDLIRLATSAHLAGELPLSTPSACKAILDGYIAGLNAGGIPFVLAESHPHLRAMAVERLKDPGAFWRKLLAGKEFATIPETVAKVLRRALPPKVEPQRLAHRIAGLGSLGRERYVAICVSNGGLIAREAKRLASSQAATNYRRFLKRAVRAPDPCVAVDGKWIVRRLAPDCSRIELADCPKDRDESRLLHAMGFETANLHLGSARAAVLLKDLAARPKEWLSRSALCMAKAVTADCRAWAASSRR